MHMWNQWFSHFKQLAITWEACLSGHTGSGSLEQLQDFLCPIIPSHDAKAAGLWEMILVARLMAKLCIGLYCGGKGRNEEDVLSPFSHIQLFVTLWITACQAPLSMGFSRQEYCSGLPCPSPGDLPNPRIKPASLVCPAFFITSAKNGQKTNLRLPERMQDLHYHTL